MTVSPSGDLSAVHSFRATQGIIFALLATIVWSFNFIAGRGLAEAMQPCTLAFCRWLTAFIVIIPFAFKDIYHDRRHFLKHWRYYGVVGVLGIAYFNTAIYMGAHTVSALNMSLIATSSPLFTLVLARVFFGERVTILRSVGILVALSGILLLITQGDITVLSALSFKSGDLLLLSAAFSFACYTLLVRKKPEGSSTLSYLAVTFGLGVVLLLPLTLFELSSGPLPHFSPRLLGGIVYMGLGASLFSFWCWSKAINSIGPSRAAIVYYSLPLFCGIEAVLMLGEPVRMIHFVAGGLILGGLVLATRQ